MKCEWRFQARLALGSISMAALVPMRRADISAALTVPWGCGMMEIAGSYHDCGSFKTERFKHTSRRRRYIMARNAYVRAIALFAAGMGLGALFEVSQAVPA